MRISKSFQTNKTLEHIFKRVGMNLIWNRGGLRGIASSLTLCHWERGRGSSLISTRQEDAIRCDLKRSAYKECALFILKTCQTIAGCKYEQSISRAFQILILKTCQTVAGHKYNQSISRVFFNLSSLDSRNTSGMWGSCGFKNRWWTWPRSWLLASRSSRVWS